MSEKICVKVLNDDNEELLYTWDSVDEIQKDWVSDECPCPCGDNMVVMYCIDGKMQCMSNIAKNKYGYVDFSSLLNAIGVKDNI